MKESIKEKQSIIKPGVAEIMREVGKQSLAALAGFLMSRGVVFQSIAPFGLAFVAAAPTDFLALSAFGAFVGYLLPLTGEGVFRYLAALFAIIAVKALLAAVTKYASRPNICALISGGLTGATGLVSGVGDTAQTLMAVAEGVLAAGGAYFLAKAFACIPRIKAGATGEELASLIISANLLLIGGMSFLPGRISVGTILAATFILLVSRFGAAGAGAICGIAAGFAVGISGGGLPTAMALCLAGLLSGVFAPFGKYAQVGVFLLVCPVGSALGADLTLTVELLIEALFGCALFLIIPKSFAMQAGKIFSPPAKTLTENGMKKAVTMRLKFAAGALSDVSQTVDTVAKELSRINTPDFEGVLRGIENEACAGCSLCVNCWEAKRADTVTAILEMIGGVREGEAEAENQAPEEFRGRCLRPARVGQAVTRHYTDYASKIAAESRIADVRSVVSEQFNGISSMLYDMADEFERDEAFDDRTAAKIVQSLKNIEIQATECGCRMDKYGRMTVEVIARRVSGTKYNRMKLLRQIELCCDRDFDPPTITESGGKVYITLIEKAVLRIETGICQIACSPSGISGDAYSTFSDGKGRSFMILSDGMGSGGRAAVDGAMASGLMTRLLKAGFGYDCSLSILNSAMLFKSTDESLATVDVACVDLFSGRCEMLKAGAAPTVVRRSGKCGVAQSTSLPAGILRDVGFDKAVVKLRAGDIIVLMSDGAAGEGTDWICAELERFADNTPTYLAEHLAQAAKRRRTDGHSDDITVLVGMVEKAV